jgi:KipI family sensor histidine kinase inhibitor
VSPWLRWPRSSTQAEITTVSGHVPPAVITEYGDCGLLVTFTHDLRQDRWAAAQVLQSALLARTDEGIVDVVASFETVFVSFNLLQTDHDAVRRMIVAGGLKPSREVPTREFSLPVVYGGERGPDLEMVANELGVTPDDVIELHTSTPWVVRFRGSPVASPMMDGPALPASVSRNPTPRTQVAPGSVGLSGQQCVIYPVASPGGWRLIGQTPARLFDLTADDLVAYRPGDRLHFRAIVDDDWDAWTSHRLIADKPARRR